MLRFGVLGAGRIGKMHAANLAAASTARLVAVADAIPEAAEAVAEATNAKAQSADEVIANPEVDAVLIASPTDTHADFIEQAVRAGKAVLCEKPVDLSSDRIAQCLEVVDAAGQPLMIAFNRRFDPNFAELKRRLDDGVVGDLETVTIVSRDPAPPSISYVERSGGLYRDMMIHDFDLARFFLGEEPVEVHAIGSVLVEPAIGEAGDVDTAMVMLRTASGKLCQISCSRRATYGYDQRVELHGAGGMLRAGNVLESTVEVATGTGFSFDPTLNFFIERYTDAYRLEIDAFVDAVESGKPPSPSGYDGLMAQRLADAASTARETGQPVRLD
ncbi:inositol 2-dehydrogenase [Bauldia sp.]|uniref:inositol 2-dehydrogenase n=1 Tax=Bauldia sp. TaxID=2575872 RepID=UPI003BA9DC88